ncbi:MAG: aminotransferase class I/II-fold pyridoxal phosphate-dependent enzyme [Deltaproteobacteria bacterium]|nr:aminotransferase class I/II-fold pyridoxal phosphate-dependent enzyme [Deltaproteobacteria bacterium]
MSDQVRVSRRVAQISKSAIHEMTRLSKQVEDVAFLSWARPTSGTPEHIGKAAAAAITQGLVGGYSENAGIVRLREAIAAKLKRDNNIEADISEILVTVGAIEGLSAAVMAVIDPGDEVLLFSPTYSTHIRQVVIASGVPVLVPTVEENDFTLDLDAVEKAITSRTRAMIVCSPNNPTGTVLSEDELRALAELALKHNLVIITDEAYEYFVFDGRQHFSIGSIPEMKERVISCYTFTKTYAMTGYRIGYLHADAAWLPQITKAHIPFAICAPVVSQYAALAALEGPQDCVVEFREHYQTARDLMCKRLDGLSSVFSYRKPGGSYLMFPKILLDEGKDSMTFCKNLLFNGRVSATPGVAFGLGGESHLRLSFCVSFDEINRAFDRMAELYG